MEQNGRHFITVLGTSLYTDCVYEIREEGFACQTPFVQLATLEHTMPDCRQGDRITVFLTEMAERSNWVTRDYTEKELVNLAGRGIQVRPGERKIGLKQRLEETYGQARIQGVSIPEGRNREELDQIFETMYAVIEPGETIIFDFTHGLRNIPMQALTIINYAKALKHIRIGGMFYGAFELGKIEEDGQRHVSLFDMSICNTILNWTSAAESFVKGGSSNQIRELYEEQAVREAEGQKKRKKTPGEKTLDSLYDLTNCLNTSRGKMDDSEKKSVRRAFQRFQFYYEKMCAEEKPLSEVALQRLFENICRDVEIFNRKLVCRRGEEAIYLDDTATGMAAVKWALQKGLTQQGFTALDETMKTYICEMYKIPVEEEKTRDTLVGQTLKFMGRQYYAKRNSSKELKKKYKDIEMPMDREELVKQRLAELERDRRLRQEDIDAYGECICRIIREIPMAIPCLSYRTGDLRNTLNHFGFQKYPASYEQFRMNLEDQYHRLERAMREFGTYWEE